MFNKTRPKTSSTVKPSVFRNGIRHGRFPTQQYYGNLDTCQKDGFYHQEYIKDTPANHSDPPYVVIKPGYRDHNPMPMFNQIDMKKRYSFKAFGDPNIRRSN